MEQLTILIYRKLTGNTPGLLFEESKPMNKSELIAIAFRASSSTLEDSRGLIAVETPTHSYRQEGFSDRDSGQ